MFKKIFFPFNEIPKNAKIAIYGSGDIATGLKNDLLRKRKDLRIVFFINTYFSGELDGYKIYNIEEIEDQKDKFDFVVLAMMSPKSREEIKKSLISNGISNFIEIESNQLSKYIKVNKFELNFKKIHLPVLDYIETHLVDHCNLNCKGCSHFCNLAQKKFADVDDMKRSFVQLSKLFSNIKVIRLMGGEPLLHPEINKIMVDVRNNFPKSEIKIATNGFLLKTMSEDFWETCRKNNIILDFSKYPPVKDIWNDLLSLCQRKGVKIGIINVADEFFAFHNSKGDSIPKQALSVCRKLSYCPLLKDSKIYICAKSAYIHYYNDYFSTNIPGDNGVEIFKTSGRQILKFLKEPVKTCAWCSVNWRKFPWAKSEKEINEWEWLEL